VHRARNVLCFARRVVVDASRPAAEVSSELTARVDCFLDTGRVEDAR